MSYNYGFNGLFLSIFNYCIHVHAVYIGMIGLLTLTSFSCQKLGVGHSQPSSRKCSIEISV